jgi:class 3 adenylate cyclase
LRGARGPSRAGAVVRSSAALPDTLRRELGDAMAPRPLAGRELGELRGLDAAALVSILEEGGMGETRKLAAILAADVVGFSRLASGDEDRPRRGGVPPLSLAGPAPLIP